MGKLYVIRYSRGGAGERACQDAIRKANQETWDALKDTPGELPEWMRAWSGPLIYEDVDAPVCAEWVARFRAATVDSEIVVVEHEPSPRSSNDKPGTVVRDCKGEACVCVPELIAADNDDFAKVEPNEWRSMLLCLFSHYTYAPQAYAKFIEKYLTGWGAASVFKLLSRYLSKVIQSQDSAESPALKRVLETLDAATESGRSFDKSRDHHLVPFTVGNHQTYISVKKLESGGWVVMYHDRQQEGYDQSQQRGFLFPDSGAPEGQSGFNFYDTGSLRSSPPSVFCDDWDKVQALCSELSAQSESGKDSRFVLDALNELGPTVRSRPEGPMMRAQRVNALNCTWASLEPFLLDAVGRDCFDCLKRGFRHFTATGALKFIDPDMIPEWELDHITSLMHRAREREVTRGKGSGKAYADLAARFEELRAKKAKNAGPSEASRDFSALEAEVEELGRKWDEASKARSADEPAAYRAWVAKDAELKELKKGGGAG
ncbi:MAG: hypothetical protein HOW73_19235 [Polyangiaceae bacterium]|nr:hypothetical protein [Polyangiaceae bacterium]